MHRKDLSDQDTQRIVCSQVSMQQQSEGRQTSKKVSTNKSDGVTRRTLSEVPKLAIYVLIDNRAPNIGKRFHSPTVTLLSPIASSRKVREPLE